MKSLGDKVKGKINATVGKVKVAAGRAMNKKSLQVKGAIQREKGHAQQIKGAIKEEI
jgi:uncharacterized protein YjbJ (UPF0337 family)